MSKRENPINLLPVDKFSKTTLGKIINWLLSTFRIIVVLVEFVVMGAFLSRFWLDAKNSDLTDELQDRQFVVEATEDLEDEMNLFMNRVYKIKLLSGANKPLLDFTNTLPTLLPPEVTLTSFEVDSKQASFYGLAVSDNHINQFIINLRSQVNISRAQITGISTENTSGLSNFQATAVLK